MSNIGTSPQQRPATGLPLSSENELRLQELYKLCQRHVETQPGPGHYKAVPASAFSRRSPHRPHQQPLDGPFLLQPGQSSTRAHDLDSFLLLGDSGVGPAAYNEGSSKDTLAPRAATAKIGTGRRVTSAVGPNQVCLSLSRSLAAGLDWRQQLTHAQIQQHLTATAAAVAAGWAGPPTALAAAAGCRVGSVSSTKPAAAAAAAAATAAAATAIAQGDHAQDSHATAAAGLAQLEEQQQGQSRDSSSFAEKDTQQQNSQQDETFVCAPEQQQQQQQQLQPEQRPALKQHNKRDPQQQQQYSKLDRSWQHWLPHLRPATTGSRARSACHMPWQLAASIQHHQHITEAMQAQADLQQQQQQQQEQAADPEQAGPNEQQSMQHQQHTPQIKQRHKSASVMRPVAVVLQHQDVLQHHSAARATTAAQQLAARRQQWEQLSCLRPPPYPVYLPDAPAATRL